MTPLAGCRRLTCLALAATLLTGCATAGPSIVVCPPLVAYDPAEQAAVADEIDAASVDARWPDWVVDYLALRERVRAGCDVSGNPG